MLIRIEEDHAKLSLVEDEDASFDVPSGWQGDYYPTYIPDGYEVFNVIPYYATVEISNVEGDVRVISKKQDRFATHEGQENNMRLDTVYHEIQGAIKLKWLWKRSNLEIDRFAYYISEKLIEAYDEQENPSRLISSYVMKGFFDSLPRQQYAQLMDALKKSKESSPDAVVIKSIEAVKGLEAEKCLFILTSDLAPYLFGQRVEDNKTSHLLYVALTRSLNSLSILVTKEVEKKYNREVIKKYLEWI